MASIIPQAVEQDNLDNSKPEISPSSMVAFTATSLLKSRVPDHSVVYENDDVEDETSEHEDDEEEVAGETKPVDTSIETEATANSSLVQDWSVVEKPSNDSSSEFSEDDDYQVDLLLLEGEDQAIKRNSISSSICICSSDDDNDDGSDFSDANESAVSNLEQAFVDMVIENPPIDGDDSDFDEEEDELKEDGVVVDEDDCIVVHEDDIPKAMGKDNKFPGLSVRQRPHLITNNRLASQVRGSR